MKNKQELEFEFLKFFFEQCNISLRDRIIIEESFEYCFNSKVPENFKINRDSIFNIEPDLISDIPKSPRLPSIPVDKNEVSNYTLNKDKETSLSDIIKKLKKEINK
jgi:hypothetical protein